jgi:meso-butanediol dehydrogenase / (S,S)-butanediol dehydrogenase / diacetyl reductase
MVSNVGKFFGSPVTKCKQSAAYAVSITFNSAVSTGDWDDLFNVNVKSMMLCYKTAANQMLKQQAEEKNSQAHYRIIGS